MSAIFFCMLAVKLNSCTLGIYACRLKGAAVDSNLIRSAVTADWLHFWSAGRLPERRGAKKAHYPHSPQLTQHV